MHRRLVLVLLLAAAMCWPALAQPPPQQPLVQFPGSSWRIAPPPGFALSNTPTVAIRHPNGAFLTIVEFQRLTLTPASFGEIGAVTAAGTPDEGRLESVEAVMAGGRPAFLVRARLPNRAAISHSVIMEGDRNNAGVSLTVPLTVTVPDSTAIRAALLSVTDRPAEAPVHASPASPAPGSVPFPGANWSIVPPPGFSLSAGPPTLFRHPNGAIIMLMEGPKERVDAAALGKIGDIGNAGTPNEGRVEAIEPLTQSGRPAALLRLRMSKRAMVVHTIVLEGEGGNANASLIVPDGTAQPDAAAIRSALLSLAEIRRSPEQRLGDLPFRLTEMAGMRVVSIIANNVVILTEGPGDLMDEAIDQPFAMVSLFPMAPRERFDPQRDLTKMAALVRERYPGATILTQKVEPRLAGPVATVVFLRTPPGKTIAVAGAAFAHTIGNAAVFMVAQFPTDRPEFAARFIKVRDGVKAK